eukprot:6181396-Pleurochrysis_carterae.AAC.1
MRLRLSLRHERSIAERSSKAPPHSTVDARYCARLWFWRRVFRSLPLLSTHLLLGGLRLDMLLFKQCLLLGGAQLVDAVNLRQLLRAVDRLKQQRRGVQFEAGRGRVSGDLDLVLADSECLFAVLAAPPA